MALEVTHLKRKFTISKDGKTIDLADPNADMSPAEVMKFYSGNHPELTNAIVDGPTVKNDQAIYNFTVKAGKLG